MKKLITLFTALLLAVPAMAADDKKDDKKKDDKKSERGDRGKGEKGGKGGKEAEPTKFDVIIEGVADDKKDGVSTALKGIADVKMYGDLVKAEKGENAYSVTLMTKKKLSRSDVSKALKEYDGVKVASFKELRPERKEREKDEKKDDKEKKDDSAADKKKDT